MRQHGRRGEGGKIERLAHGEDADVLVALIDGGGDDLVGALADGGEALLRGPQAGDVHADQLLANPHHPGQGGAIGIRNQQKVETQLRADLAQLILDGAARVTALGCGQQQLQPALREAFSPRIFRKRLFCSSLLARTRATETCVWRREVRRPSRTVCSTSFCMAQKLPSRRITKG
jgi:hypothetical protein